jgi:hypothetical protein
MKMSDYKAIDKHIRAAHLQRSAMIGTALGELIARAWFGAAELLGRRPAVATKPAASH